MRLEDNQLESIVTQMMKKLIRMRVLDRSRLFDRYYTVAIDGIHTHTFGYKHCDNCLSRKDDKGKIIWMHHKLQASLVTPSGLCLPMATEWIENKEAKYNKQDCEIKAFKRLIIKLRKLYPKLQICVLLDALYSTNPITNHIKKYDMEYIIVFKKGNMPESYDWAINWLITHATKNKIADTNNIVIANRHSKTHEQRTTRKKPQCSHRTRKIKTTYAWMSDIKHWDDKRIFNVMRCKETVDGKTKCDYTWIVSDGLKLSKQNVRELAKRGRLRWVIENQGINVLKNGGYRLEHLYSRDPVSMKSWQRIMDIAFLINQLIMKGSLIAKEAFGSAMNVAKQMFEHLKYLVFTKPLAKPKIQIRLRWDTS